jgi:hypothetical protein
MNKNTRVAVCCYGGDAHQVIKSLGAYLHHECPVVILSPTDCPADIRYPGVENRFAGKRAYIGQESLDRQRLHLELLLTFPEEYFLVHDADSVCLSPEIPSYLYANLGPLLWSNVVEDGIPGRESAYPAGYPKIAFQPPYFMARQTIKKLLTGTEAVRANPTLPFIDHVMLQWAMESECPWKTFQDGVSCPFSLHPPSRALVLQAVRERGIIFIHSVKDEPGMKQLFWERQKYLMGHNRG